jgi:hypothetical protein
MEYGLRYKRLDLVHTFIQLAVPWGCLLGIAVFAYLAIRSLAGTHTLADIGIGLKSGTKLADVIGWLTGLAGIGYGHRERKLRRDTIERLAARNRELEQLIDPSRTSSKLMPRGTTRPEDKP